MECIKFKVNSAEHVYEWCLQRNMTANTVLCLRHPETLGIVSFFK
jgi:hypothetical protein